MSKYPDIFAALIEDDEFEWTDEDLGKLANQNLIRTFRKVEEVAELLALEGRTADNTWVPVQDLGNDTQCRTDYGQM